MNNLLIMPKTATTFPIYPYQYIGGAKAASLWRITGSFEIEAAQPDQLGRFICAQIVEKITVKKYGGGMNMEEQYEVLKQLDDFLSRRGLKINFLSKQVGISVSTLYNFRSGSRLLSQRQIQALREFMTDYDQKLGGEH